jgi:hypothetical protein
VANSPRTVLLSDGSFSAASAVQRSEPLSQLLARVRQSQERLMCINALLPASLVGVVRPGPLDDVEWALLVPGNAVAAKLRQCLPTLEAGLLAAGWPARALKVRIQANP